MIRCLVKLQIKQPVLSLTSNCNCYIIDITHMKKGEKMYIEIDFNSDEALYMQLRNQIILGIATHQYVEGDSLPSVRQLAEEIGINMHTVNKAYGVLKQEGLIRLDRRRGAVISLDLDKIKAMTELSEDLRMVIAKACCKNVSRDEIHAMIDDIYEEYGGI